MTDETGLAVIYSVWPDQAAAERMAEALITSRLAACINILAPMTSLYRWRGALQRDSEVPVLIKTRATLAEQAIAAARTHHPYETPAFLVFPASGAFPPYRDWVFAETGG